MARRGRRAVVGSVLSVAVVLTGAGPASATWSLVAIDRESGQVGVALASCVPADVLGSPDGPLVPVVVIPASLAAVSQGQLNLDAPTRIRELAAAGATGPEIVGELIDPSFDELAATRQHAVVGLDGAPAAFTGGELAAAALDRQGADVSVQGNLLVSDEVVVVALAGYEQSRRNRNDLAEALVDGLLAGSLAGGDRRCGPQTALFAQVVVASVEDPPTAPSTVLTVTVDQGDGQNPVVLLADAMAQGQRGRIEAGRGAAGGGGVVRIALLAGAVVMAGVGLGAFMRGLGSVRSRR